MTYQIEQSQFFLDQFRMLPADVVPRVQRGIAALRQDPRPFGKNRTALRATRDPKQYRLRIANYRLIYSFDGDTVFLRNVDRRAEVYVHNTGKGYVSVPEAEITANDDTIEVDVSGQPTPGSWNLHRQQLASWVDVANESAMNAAREAASATGRLQQPVQSPTEAIPPAILPTAITPHMLIRIGIPKSVHQILLACKTDADLVAATVEHGVDASIVDRVFNLVTETTVDPVTPQPVRKLREIEDLKRFYEGDLLDFQVALDPVQKPISSLIGGSPGAWLVTGSAGTGKSTVLLDAALNEYQAGKEREDPPSILITTFTNALVTTLKGLVERISGGECADIQIQTVNSIALEVVEAVEPLKPVKKNDSIQGLLRPIVQDILVGGARQETLFEGAGDLTGQYIAFRPLTNMTWSYLLEEIEDVIIGRNVLDREDYLTSPRTGRKVGLSETQRNRIWDIHLALAREIERRGWTTYPRTVQRAADLLATRSVEFPFDALFVDEAQDLQPNAIRMLVEMAKTPGSGIRRLCLAADRNQTIYGSGYSWVSIHPDLRLQGRSRSLKVNHRSTRQIVEAARAYLSGAELDQEPDDLEHRHIGPKPLAMMDVQPEEEFGRIHDYLCAQTSQIGRGYEMCAVLVPDQTTGENMQARFTAVGIPSAFMRRGDVHLNYPGVKIVTRHTAKGLEFPIVALALSSAKRPQGETPEELLEAVQLERRLNHMAMTRAMRSLLVTFPGALGSGDFSGISRPLWEIGLTEPAGTAGYEKA